MDFGLEGRQGQGLPLPGFLYGVPGRDKPCPYPSSNPKSKIQNPKSEAFAKVVAGMYDGLLPKSKDIACAYQKSCDAS